MDEGRVRAEAAVADGSAEAVWNRWIEAQGGTADESALEQAPIVREVDGAAGGLDRAPRRDPGRRRGAPPGRGPPREERHDRPCRRRRLPAQARRASSRRATSSPRCTPATTRRRTPAVREVLGRLRARRRAPPRTARAARGHRVAGGIHGAASVFACPSCPRSRASGARLAPVLEGRQLERVEIADARLTRPFDPDRGRSRARGRASRRRRPARQVFDCSVRVGTGSPDSPPDDGVAATPAAAAGRFRTIPTAVPLSD